MASDLRVCATARLDAAQIGSVTLRFHVGVSRSLFSQVKGVARIIKMEVWSHSAPTLVVVAGLLRRNVCSTSALLSASQ
jgi:hypothetical protein